VGDRLYLCSALNKISALDAATGRDIWTFDPQTPADAVGYIVAIGPAITTVWGPRAGFLSYTRFNQFDGRFSEV